MDDLLVDFLTETRESLAELDAGLLELERTPGDQATLSLIFRGVHTIKGTCGFLGLPRLERLAHAAENVLGQVRDGALAATPDMISLVLSALDGFKAIVNALSATGAEPPGTDATLIAALNTFAEGKAAAPPPPPVMVIVPDPDASPMYATAEELEAAFNTAVFESPAEQTPAEIVAVPMPEPCPPDEPGGGTPAPTASATAAPASASTIRVGVEVLENLMTLVSELVLTRNQLLQLARTQENTAFTAPLQRLSHITSDLQEGVMKTRMQPVGSAWNKLPRLVRDLTRDLDKKIELVMSGADTELDRQVLEMIKDPLTHMVRNSGDHGLENPAERRAAGKPDTGRIMLNAFHEGGHIIMEIADDGRGLAVGKIRAKALANGLATDAELAGMTDQQIQRFIFRAGFSTAAAVTSVSGRGVGMDVVKTNIEKIGGTIDLRSVEGSGTTFTVKIPLTLAIVSALIVEAGGERFAIPQISVVELVRAQAGDDTSSASLGTASDGSTAVIEHIDHTPVLRLRNRLLPLVSLTELLKLEAAPAEKSGSYIVVASVGSATMGLIVDRVFDTEEIVVKPVSPILRHITMFSGNTILGDGSVIMILDPNGIARATGGLVGEQRNAVRSDDPTGKAERTPMLIFRAGSGGPQAVPLGLVARIEDITNDRIEYSGDQPVTQYRGKLMPLLPLSGRVGERTSHPVLVFAEGDRSMGLIVDEIVDVVQEHLKIGLSAVRPGMLGTAIVAGKSTDILDTAHWLTRAWRDWFSDTSGETATRSQRLLVVEDSSFFRQMLIPMLSAAGFEVTGADSATAAIALRDAGVAVHAIISDIDMPGMSGIELARQLRSGGAWADVPMLALSANAASAAAALTAGFDGFVAKSDREKLLPALKTCLHGKTKTIVEGHL